MEPFLSSMLSNGAEWIAYQLKFNKSYATQEEHDYRHSIWLNKTMDIISANSKNPSFSMGWNPFTDWTAEEFQAQRLGQIDSPTNVSSVLAVPHLGEFRHEGTLETLPSDWDWSTAKVEVVTRVKDQKCGDCWAFSASGCLEGALAVANGWTKDLSAQQFVDCESKDGCGGGDKAAAMSWAKKQNICSWDSYPETGKDGSCHSSGCHAVITLGSIWGTYRVKPNDEGSLCAALMQRPIAISVATGDSFHHYSSGILDASYPSKTSHAILAVGYGYWNGKAYWKVKNSWGTHWGLSGYGLLKRGGGSNQNLIESKPYGVYVYGPYNPQIELIGLDGTRISPTSSVLV